MHSFYYPNRIRVTLDCGTELITKQEFKDECDINNILTQFKKTGIINHITQSQPLYTDLPDELDYQSSLSITAQASDAFATLPSAVRRFFNNNPAELLAALENPAMRGQLEELNILVGPGNPQPPGNPINNNPSVAPSLATTPRLPTTNGGAAVQPPPPPPAPTE